MVYPNNTIYSLSINVEYKVEYQNIKIISLVGKYAIRIRPFMYINGLADYSFMGESVKILSMNADGSFTINFYGMKSQMDKEWDDGNWTQSSVLDSLD